VAGKWVTPMEYYTLEKTMVMIDNAKFVVNLIETYLKTTTQKK
jgi:hypothetical protein